MSFGFSSTDRFEAYCVLIEIGYHYNQNVRLTSVVTILYKYSSYDKKFHAPTLKIAKQCFAKQTLQRNGAIK